MGKHGSSSGEREAGNSPAGHAEPVFRLERAVTIHKGWTSLERVTISDGRRRQEREIEHHGNAAAVLPYDPQRRTVALVRVLRAPLVMEGGDGWSLEAPAGIVDEGEAFDETARREATEETGIELDDLDHVATVWSSPGTSRERVGLYLATYRRDGSALKAADEDEMVHPVEISLDELAALAEEGRIHDMKTLALTLALRHRRPDLFA